MSVGKNEENDEFEFEIWDTENFFIFPRKTCYLENS